MEVMGINMEAGVTEEWPAFWHWMGDVTSAFNLSITVVGLGADKWNSNLPILSTGWGDQTCQYLWSAGHPVYQRVQSACSWLHSGQREQILFMSHSALFNPIFGFLAFMKIVKYSSNVIENAVQQVEKQHLHKLKPKYLWGTKDEEGLKFFTLLSESVNTINRIRCEIQWIWI